MQLTRRVDNFTLETHGRPGLREAAGEDSEVTATVRPVITGLTEQCDIQNVFRFDRLSIVTYRSEEERMVSQVQFTTHS